MNACINWIDCKEFNPDCKRADQLLGDGEIVMSASALAAKERLRPIIMTSIASLAGFFPLVIATGAGAGAVFRHSIGTVIFGGVLISTISTLIIVPAFYIVVKQIKYRISGDRFKSLE